MPKKYVGPSADGGSDLVTGVHILGSPFLFPAVNGSWSGANSAMAIGDSADFVFIGGVDTLEDQMYLIPFVPMRDCTIDQVGIHVQATGFTGSYRTGFYNHAVDSNGSPSLTLKYDDGANLSTSTGVQTRTFTTAQSFDFGKLYYFGIAQQGGVANTTLWGMQGQPFPYFPVTGAAASNVLIGDHGTGDNMSYAVVKTGVTGAFPDPLTGMTLSDADANNKVGYPQIVFSCSA